MLACAARPVLLADLRVQGPVVVQHADQEQPEREQVDQTRAPLAHVEAVHAEDAEKGEQDPSHRIIDRPARVARLGGALHPGDEEQVDQPADAEQAEGEEPDRARDRAAEVEAVRAKKAEDPQQVADQLAVGVVRCMAVGHGASRGGALRKVRAACAARAPRRTGRAGRVRRPGASRGGASAAAAGAASRALPASSTAARRRLRSRRA